MKKLLFGLILSALVTSGCVKVKIYQREHLEDPLMDVRKETGKQKLDEKFFSTREGSMGGASGIAGGCGCAK
ncbi:MAG: DUF4266 domain-containing protein [Calditrichaeota bacterium]|nr:MAG: DUF4266 domain-containing protein [Calditrichota bacterium]